MSAVSTLEFTSRLPFATDFAPTTDNRSFDSEADSTPAAVVAPATIPMTKASSSVAEDLTASVALLVMGVASACFIGYMAANFYASLIQYGPFEIIRAMGGLH